MKPMVRGLRYTGMSLVGILTMASYGAAKPLPVIKPVMACSALAERDVVVPGEAPARIVTAREVADQVTPYCEVRGYVAPQVKFELRLPMQNWMQRLMFSGCGGFCGRVQMRIRVAEGCAGIENGEFALVTSDLGHDTPDGNGDTVWAASNRQGQIDYGYRGVHVVSVTAKAIIAQFYGQHQRYAYFNGCSDGGREGMMAVQRYPTDFDGVIAGASVIHDTLNNSVYHGWSARHLRRANGDRMFSEEDLTVLHRAALAACDAVGDNVVDGVIGDPSACRFDPETAQCSAQKTSGCLTAEQIAAARALYSGPLDPAGKPLYFGRPIGSEKEWGGPDVLAYVRSFVTYMATDRPQQFNLATMGFDPAALRIYNANAKIYNATASDLSAFRASGGKLIMWHGWSDAAVPPMSTVDYYNRVRQTMGNGTDDFLRVYMLPGVAHCQGGDGPDKLNLVDAIISWVEDGAAPDAIVPMRKIYGRTVQTRPVYPYPAFAAYKGSGDSMDASSFVRRP